MRTDVRILHVAFDGKRAGEKDKPITEYSRCGMCEKIE